MSIEKTWEAMDGLGDTDLSEMLQASTLSTFTSQDPLEKIRKTLLINMIWGLLFCLLYATIVAFLRVWQVQAAFAVVLLLSLWALHKCWLQYKELLTAVSPAGTLLIELKRHHRSISNWMTLQQTIALFIYPVSITGGFMLGRFLKSGSPVEISIDKPVFLLALLVMLVVLVPTSYYLARWMFNYSFGKHLQSLQQNIHALEEEK